MITFSKLDDSLPGFITLLPARRHGAGRCARRVARVACPPGFLTLSIPSYAHNRLSFWKRTIHAFNSLELLMPKHFTDANHAHYLTFGCYKRQHLFKPEELRTLFLQQLIFSRERYAFKLYAWVVMPSHIHLLIHPTDTSLSTLLRGIKRPFSTKAIHWYEKNQPQKLHALEIKRGNDIVRRFWQEGGGYDRNLYSPEAIYKSISYIHNNPVRAGLVDDILDWKWSSARYYELDEDSGLKADKLQHI